MRPAASEAARAELQSLLTMAADWESRRQTALQRGDQHAVERAETELRRLWARHWQLERLTA